MNPISAALYGYSLFTFLRNRKNESGNNAGSVSPNSVRKLIDERADYLLTQRDVIHNLDYSKFIKVVDSRFWYQKVYMNDYAASSTLYLQNISNSDITIIGMVVDWAIDNHISDEPMFTIKPVILKPGETGSVVLFSRGFQYFTNKSGVQYVLSVVDLRKSIAFTDKTYTESSIDIVELNIGLFISLNTGEFAYRELEPYYCKIKLNEAKYNLEELKRYTGYSYKNGSIIFNQIRLWKAKGYNGLPFKMPDNSIILSDEEYNEAISDYKNVEE